MAHQRINRRVAEIGINQLTMGTVQCVKKKAFIDMLIHCMIIKIHQKEDTVGFVSHQRITLTL